MSKEFTLEEISDLMILFEQAEALLDPKEIEALKTAETTFSKIIDNKTKIYGGPPSSNETQVLWEKTLDNIPGSRKALQLKFEKAKFLWSASQARNPQTH